MLAVAGLPRGTRGSEPAPEPSAQSAVEELLVGRLHARLELPGGWSLTTIDQLMVAARQLASPHRRVGFWADVFLRHEIPFELESSLPEMRPGVLRFRLCSLDCITLFYYVNVLAFAQDVREAVELLASIRYAGTVRSENRIHYAVSSLRRMVALGIVRDVTAELAPPGALATRQVRLGLKADGQPFLGHRSHGDACFGRPVSARFIPTGSFREVEPRLIEGDSVLLVSAKDPAEYPGIVWHALVVKRPAAHAPAWVLHAGRSRVGSPEGPTAGVSMLRLWDTAAGALRPDGEPRPLLSYLEENPDLWQGAMVVRPQQRFGDS